MFMVACVVGHYRFFPSFFPQNTAFFQRALQRYTESFASFTKKMQKLNEFWKTCHYHYWCVQFWPEKSLRFESLQNVSQRLH